MTRQSVRVVVNCAGAGTRLGFGVPKALVEIHGQPILWWHLRMLEDVEDVVVVAGFRADDVVDLVRSAKPDAQVRINAEYSSTGTAASLVIGAQGAEGDVLSLDGDLLVHPADLDALVSSGGARLGVAPPTTDEPVYVATSSGPGGPMATSFNRTGPGVEWTGLVRIPARTLLAAAAAGLGRGHVYQLLEPALPLPTMPVRVREIDTPDDYARAVEWFADLALGLRQMEPRP